MIALHRINDLEIHACQPRKSRKIPPLLFIHGAFAGAWMWSETFMPFLAQAGYASYALSLRGHGESWGKDSIDWHSIDDYVDDVCGVIEQIGGDAILIGHSMGGFIAQKVLERRSVAALALLCSVPPQGLAAAQVDLFFRSPELFHAISRVLGNGEADTKVIRDALFAQAVAEETLVDWLSRMQSESHRALWDMSFFNLPNPLRMHRPPMLILGAEKDRLVPASQVKITACTYGLPHRIFEGMGHALTHEKDWPQVAETLQTWLAAQED